MSHQHINEQAAHQSTDPAFYQAVQELAENAAGIIDNLEALESALTWCKDHNVTLGFNREYVNIMLPAPYHHMVWGPTFLDAVEQGRTWIEGFDR